MIRAFLALYLLTLFSSALAIEVEDDSGRHIVISQPAQRIVSLAPHVTEQLFAIGAGQQIVGAVAYSDYPEAAKKIPRVGGYSQLDLERILALKPDLIIAWQSGNNAQSLERLESLGMRVYRSEPRQLDDIARSMERLGQLSGKAQQASQQARRFREKLSELRKQVAPAPPRRLFYQIWNRPLMTVNGEHLINDVITLCGGENIFADLPALTPRLSEEAVVIADPDLIIASGMGVERPEWLDDWRRWPKLLAVKTNRLFVINPNLIQRATPRVLQGAELMCQFIRS